jgi:MFS family permease
MSATGSLSNELTKPLLLGSAGEDEMGSDVVPQPQQQPQQQQHYYHQQEQQQQQEPSPEQHHHFQTPPRKRTLSSLNTRWFILGLTCLVMTGNYYSYDTPAALHQQLKDYMMERSEANNDNDNDNNNSSNALFEFNFNLLYTVYSIPNVILPFYSGNISDKFGSSKCTAFFAALTFCGQLVFALGASYRNWQLMLLGRCIYGLGGESITVSSSSMLAKWFAGGEVALALGVNLAVSRMGSVLNNMLSPAIANASSSPPMALYVGAMINLASFAAAIGVMVVDRRAQSKFEKQQRNRALLTASFLEDDHPHLLHPRNYGMEMMDHGSVVTQDEGYDYDNEDDEPPAHLSDVKHFGIMFWLVSLSCVVVYGCVLPFNNIASGVLLERNYFGTPEPAPQCILWYPDQCTSGTLATKLNPSRYADNTPCPGPNYAPVLPSSLNITSKDQQDDSASSSWLSDRYVYHNLQASDVDCIDPFWSHACTKNYCDAQKQATEVAGRVMSIPYFLSATLSPPLGYIVDMIGSRATIASLAPLLLICVHGTLAWGSGSPIVPLIFQGVAYSLFASVIWPSVPLTVADRFVGTAYGAMTSVQNIGLALFPLIIAAIYESTQHYVPSTELFFVALAAFGLIIGVALNYYDKRTGGNLNAVHLKQYYNMMTPEEEEFDATMQQPLSHLRLGASEYL